MDHLGNRRVPSRSQRGHLLVSQLELGEESLGDLSSHFQPVTVENKRNNLIVLIHLPFNI